MPAPTNFYRGSGAVASRNIWTACVIAEDAVLSRVMLHGKPCKEKEVAGAHCTMELSIAAWEEERYERAYRRQSASAVVGP